MKDRCDKCKGDLAVEGAGEIACVICEKTYRRCRDCGGLAGAKRSLTAHAGLLHTGKGAGPGGPLHNLGQNQRKV